MSPEDVSAERQYQVPTTFKTVFLPDRGEMLFMLRQVSDDPRLVESFYPRLFWGAECRMTGCGVMMMVKMALTNCTKELPPEAKAELEALVEKQFEAFLAALIDIHEVLHDAVSARSFGLELMA